MSIAGALALLAWGCAGPSERREDQALDEAPAAPLGQPRRLGDPLGEWVVVGHRMPGISAMSESEAAARHGSTIRFEASQAASGADTCRQAVYRHRDVAADSLMREFRLVPSQLGLDGPTLGLTRVACGDADWATMGGTLIWIDEVRVYAPWDGVFFELRRK